ncbi:hypothetical protein JTB14_025343 [Gonioctena quinquepunctata]|nr:hypothetical protein JTB14_025343 [Gonioctena quinquepunctata]
MKLRLICLLNSISKVHEGLLKERLEREIEVTGGLSENQFGFRKKRSTIQAVDRTINLVRDSTSNRSSTGLWMNMFRSDLAYIHTPMTCHAKDREELNWKGNFRSHTLGCKETSWK